VLTPFAGQGELEGLELVLLAAAAVPRLLARQANTVLILSTGTREVHRKYVVTSKNSAAGV